MQGKIRGRLSGLLTEIKSIKNQLLAIRQLHKQFTFQSVLSKTDIPTRKHRPSDMESNKENIQNAMNRSTRTQLKQLKQQRQALKSLCSEEICEEVVEGLGDRNRNQEMRDIKANLILQLSEIKSIEKKSESMRRANEKIQEYSSSQKRNYHQSISRDKNTHKDQSHNRSEQSRSSTVSNPCDKSIQSFTQDSKISLQSIPNPPSQQQDPTITLKCNKGHEYYEGSINSYRQPHGNGRLEICCGNIPLDLGHNGRDFVFYQGQFKDGKFHGFGTLSYKGGVKYVGEFRQGARHGKGSMYCNGKAEVASWQNDTFISII